MQVFLQTLLSEQDNFFSLYLPKFFFQPCQPKHKYSQIWPEECYESTLHHISGHVIIGSVPKSCFMHAGMAGALGNTLPELSDDNKCKIASSYTKKIYSTYYIQINQKSSANLPFLLFYQKLLDIHYKVITYSHYPNFHLILFFLIQKCCRQAAILHWIGNLLDVDKYSIICGHFPNFQNMLRKDPRENFLRS